jgi:hypothetical protein
MTASLARRHKTVNYISRTIEVWLVGTAIDLPGFIAAEIGGAVAGLMLMSWLLRSTSGATAIDRETQL